MPRLVRWPRVDEDVSLRFGRPRPWVLNPGFRAGDRETGWLDGALGDGCAEPEREILAPLPVRPHALRLPLLRPGVTFAPALEQGARDARCGAYAAYHAVCLERGTEPERRTFEELAAALGADVEDMDEGAIEDFLVTLGENRIAIVSDVQGALAALSQGTGNLANFFPALAQRLEAFRAEPGPLTLVVRTDGLPHWFATQIVPEPDGRFQLRISESIATLHGQAEVTARALRGLLERQPALPHAALLVPRPIPPAPPVDLENVMRSDRIERARDCVRALLGDEGVTGLDEGTRGSIEHYLSSLEAAVWDRTRGLTDPERATLARRRGRTGSVLENARRTLSGRRQHQDYSESLASGRARFTLPEGAADLGDISARVWRRIDRYQASTSAETSRDRRAMRWAFLMALDQSIEDDGHRVCGVGLAERLVGVLQGYYPDIHADPEIPTPRQLLTDLGRGWQERFAEASGPGIYEEFRREALSRARELLGTTGRSIQEFESELEEFIHLCAP